VAANQLTQAPPAGSKRQPNHAYPVRVQGSLHHLGEFL
jgi:hypothetical protein